MNVSIVAAPTSDNEDANSGNKTAKVSKRRTSAAASEAFADLASPASRRMSLRTRR